MKFGSNFLIEPDPQRLLEFQFDNYSVTEMMTCDHLNIAEITKLLAVGTQKYVIEPPVFQGEDMLILKIPVDSLAYLFEHKDFFDELYQTDLNALEKFHNDNENCNLFEIATWWFVRLKISLVKLDQTRVLRTQ